MPIVIRSLALAATLLATTVSANPDVVWRYEARTHLDGQGNEMPYRLFIPDQYDPAERYPLVLYLHGSGNRGRDNVYQITDDCGPDMLTRPAVQMRYPSFVVAPQAPTGGQWGFYLGSTAPVALAIAIVRELQREFSIDAQRIYVTGYSMGGLGSFYLLDKYPELFAAALPLAGGGSPEIAHHIRELPLWAFHGERDYFVPITGRVRDGIEVYGTQDMITALRAAGGNPRFTLMEGYGHLIPCWVYSRRDVIDWLFAQRRLPSATPVDQVWARERVCVASVWTRCPRSSIGYE